ncbi:MAG: hypothetical protein K2X09_04335 [Rickettsiales bacterium]|mgnify:CR=1 FL=1|nr:hypothetical protein [Rickettsiales bacterium]
MVSYHTAEAEQLGEPTLDELFAEPIVRLVMKRDGVEESEMRGQITRVQRDYRMPETVQ